jgi:hypothetical protein
MDVSKNKQVHGRKTRPEHNEEERVVDLDEVISATGEYIVI